MNTKIVKNISDNDLTIPEIGVVKSGETIKVSADFNNANFEVVKSEVVKDEVETKKSKN